MERLKPVDVVVIGGGFTGLLMAKELATRTSVSVVVLERGPDRQLLDYMDDMDEVDFSLRFRMMQNISEETVTHRHTTANRAVPVREWGHVRLGTGTGGSGEHWTGVANRYPEDTFIIKSALKERFPASRIPADLSVQDWTLTWKDIEPFYTRVEEMMGIGGKAGNLQGRRIDGGNVFEGPRSKEYPVRPHLQSYAMTVFEKAARELGYHPYINPAATLPADYTNPDGISRPACQYCSYCMLYGCMIGAKAQPTNLLLPILKEKKTFTLRNGCWVRKIVHRDGRAEGVEYMDENGREIFQPASVVVQATFTSGNVRSLLLSKIGTPYDPATGRGTLGKNFTHQMSGGGNALLVYPTKLNAFMAAGGQGMAFSDFDGFNQLDPDANILRGGTFTGGGGGGHPIASFGTTPPGTSARNWGSAWKQAAIEHNDRTGGGPGFSAEHLSYRHNFLDLDPTYTDKWGDPLLRTTIDWTDHERRMRDFSAKISDRMAEEMARVSGAKIHHRPAATTGRRSGRYQTATYATTHLHGGAIMGDTPADGVVNTYLQHWDVPNLFVIGASAFPHAGPTNPTMTALALTFRSADALIERYLKNPGKLV